MALSRHHWTIVGVSNSAVVRSIKFNIVIVSNSGCEWAISMIHLSLRSPLPDLSNGVLFVRLASESYKLYVIGVWWSAYRWGVECKKKKFFFRMWLYHVFIRVIFWFQKCNKFLFRIYLNNVTPTERTTRRLAQIDFYVLTCR